MPRRARRARSSKSFVNPAGLVPKKIAVTAQLEEELQDEETMMAKYRQQLNTHLSWQTSTAEIRRHSGIAGQGVCGGIHRQRTPTRPKSSKSSKSRVNIWSAGESPRGNLGKIRADLRRICGRCSREDPGMVATRSKCKPRERSARSMGGFEKSARRSREDMRQPRGTHLRRRFPNLRGILKHLGEIPK